jgi:glycosyltransferase involved in cell wall biosynthesis
MNKQLSTIAVDLTPILPGGENGGAKIFVLELLHRLAEMAPRTQFVLLTQVRSHEELATLDRPNMRRLMVIGPVVANSFRARLTGLALRILPHLPIRLRNVTYRLGYKLNMTLKRCGSGSLLRDMSVDLLFCPFTAPTYFESGIPMVCTIYDLQYKIYPEFFAAEDVAHRERTFIEACRRATRLTAISNYSRDSAIAYGNIDPSRIRTIYLRMAQRIVSSAVNDKGVLAHYGLTPQRYLIYPANFWKHKNHEMLLTAFGMACHGGLAADIKLVCTGAPGARQEWLMSAARSMNLGDRVVFPGYLPNDELASLLANSSGMLFPSLYEGFGLPVIEAMAAGVPVACSNTTSLPEVAADAVIFFDPRIPTQIAQTMFSLVKNDALRARFIQAGLQRAAEFSDSTRMAREYWELFQTALSDQKHVNMLTGVYADGWTGPILNIQVGPDASAQTLEIEISAPEWLPYPHLTVQTTRHGNLQGNPLVFDRGTNAVLSLPMEPTGGCYEVRIAPSFVPAHLVGHGDDQRELSLLLQRCGIVHADGKRIELFPDKVPA